MDPYEHPGCVCWPCKWWWEWCPCQKWPIFFFCQSSWTISGCVTHHIALWTFALWTCGRNDTVVLENNKGLGIKLNSKVIIFDNHLAVRKQSQWEDTHSHHKAEYSVMLVNNPRDIVIDQGAELLSAPQLLILNTCCATFILYVISCVILHYIRKKGFGHRET